MTYGLYLLWTPRCLSTFTVFNCHPGQPNPYVCCFSRHLGRRCGVAAGALEPGGPVPPASQLSYLGMAEILHHLGWMKTLWKMEIFSIPVLQDFWTINRKAGDWKWTMDRKTEDVFEYIVFPKLKIGTWNQNHCYMLVCQRVPSLELSKISRILFQNQTKNGRMVWMMHVKDSGSYHGAKFSLCTSRVCILLNNRLPANLSIA